LLLIKSSDYSAFWDPVHEAEFNISTPEKTFDPFWWEGTSGGLVEPIWVTAEKQGLISAVHMWPGSEAKIQGVRPTHYDTFDHDELLSNKVNRLLTWLDIYDEDRPSYIGAYVPDIDVCVSWFFN
jgi:Type I phosphodiesterase / nucleotide pyrophosphatase